MISSCVSERVRRSSQCGGSRDCQSPLQWRRALPCLVQSCVGLLLPPLDAAHAELQQLGGRHQTSPRKRPPTFGLPDCAALCAAACLYMARANPGARPYREMLGEVVLKHFEGHGTFMGTIIEYDEQTGFRIQVTPSA